jgi:hypothetical protein
MSCRTRFRKVCLFSLVVLATVAVLAFTAPAQTAPGSYFELDGNTVVNTPGNCDWDVLNAHLATNTTTPAAPCAEANATQGAYSFIVGGPGEPAFTGGGSKDSNDISSAGITKGVWAWSDTSTPDKDTLADGFATSYSTTAGDKILEFGALLFAPNGNANIGIWFFQNPVNFTPLPAAFGGSATKGSFTGVHAAGDIFVVSAFTGGGGNSSVSVYEWDPTCTASNYPAITGTGKLNPPVCAATNIKALWFNQTTSNSGDDAFAIVNSGTISVNWPFQAKFTTTTTCGTATTSDCQVPATQFYEGGVDLTTLLPAGQNAPCFSSFLFETRASQTINSVLKDVLLGAFPQCHLSIRKSCTCNSFNPDESFNYSYTGSVINDGGGDLFNIQVVDTPANGGTSATYNCGNLARGTGAPPSITFPTGCTLVSGNSTATWTTTAHESSNSVTATAQTSASGGTTIDAFNADDPTMKGYTAACTDKTLTSCTFSAALTVTKDCVTAFQAASNTSPVQVRVDYDGTVTNTGQVNLHNVTVTDDVDSATYNVGDLSVANPTKCYTDTNLTSCPALTVTDGLSAAPASVASYTPTGADALGLIAGRISFTDTVHATGCLSTTSPCPTGPTACNGGSCIVNANPESATCEICPSGACSTNTH